MSDPRAQEQLRQERAIFEEVRRQGAQWFGLRLAMGYAGMLLLFGIAAVSGYILLNAAYYSPMIVSVAATILLADVMSLAVSIFKLVLQQSSAVPLNPITRGSPQDEA